MLTIQNTSLLLKKKTTLFPFRFPIGIIFSKNTHGTCFISNFSREMDWEWSRICQRPPSNSRCRRQRQPGRVTSGYVIFSKTHMAHVYIDFFKRNRLGMVSDTGCSLIVFFPRILESLPPLHCQHSAAIGCTKYYQPIGVTVHSPSVESL